MKKLSTLALIFVSIIVWAAAPVWASRNSSGTYTLPSTWNPVQSGTPITKDWANGTLNDIATEITASLDRNGRGSMNAPLRLNDGSQAAPGVAFGNEPGSGFYRIGAADVALSVNGTKRQEWTSAGTIVTGNAQAANFYANDGAGVSYGTGTGNANDVFMLRNGGVSQSWNNNFTQVYQNFLVRSAANPNVARLGCSSGVGCYTTFETDGPAALGDIGSANQVLGGSYSANDFSLTARSPADLYLGGQSYSSGLRLTTNLAQITTSGTPRLSINSSSVTTSADLAVTGAASVAGASGLVVSGGHEYFIKPASDQAILKTGGDFYLATTDAHDLYLQVNNGTLTPQVRLRASDQSLELRFGDLNFTRPNVQNISKTGGSLYVGTDDANLLALKTGATIRWYLDASDGSINSSGGNKLIHGVLDPGAPQDAATKNYVDGKILAPGGADSTVQYRVSSTSFGGASNTYVFGGNLTLAGQDSFAHSGNEMKIGAVRTVTGTNSALQPAWVDGASTLPMVLQGWGGIGGTRGGCFLPNTGGGNGTALQIAMAVGSMPAPLGTLTSWTITNAAPSNGTELNRQPRIAATRVSTAGSFALYAQADLITRQGGFSVWGSAGPQRGGTFADFLFGLTPAGTITDPAISANGIYIGCTNGSTLQACGVDSGGTANCTALGGNFPCADANVAGVIYDWALWAAPGASTVSYAVRRRDAGPYTASGTISSARLPAATTYLHPAVMAYGDPSTALNFFGICAVWAP